MLLKTISTVLIRLPAFPLQTPLLHSKKHNQRNSGNFFQNEQMAVIVQTGEDLKRQLHQHLPVGVIYLLVYPLVPLCRFIRDVTFLDGEKIPPTTEFIKIWHVKNDGNRVWPEGCCLVPAGGDYLQVGNDTKLPQLEAGDEIDISVTLCSPSVPGRYVSYFRPQTHEGRWFGQRLWSDIRVTIPEPSEEIPSLIPLHESKPTPVGSSAWAHELSLLASMGFNNEAECLSTLEKYSMKRGLLTGQTQRSSAEIMQLTVSDLLRR